MLLFTKAYVCLVNDLIAITNVAENIFKSDIIKNIASFLIICYNRNVLKAKGRRLRAPPRFDIFWSA